MLNVLAKDVAIDTSTGKVKISLVGVQKKRNRSAVEEAERVEKTRSRRHTNGALNEIAIGQKQVALLGIESKKEEYEIKLLETSSADPLHKLYSKYVKTYDEKAKAMTKEIESLQSVTKSIIAGAPATDSTEEVVSEEDEDE